jgi:hypothetical protein
VQNSNKSVTIIANLGQLAHFVCKKANPELDICTPQRVPGEGIDDWSTGILTSRSRSASSRSTKLQQIPNRRSDHGLDSCPTHQHERRQTDGYYQHLHRLDAQIERENPCQSFPMCQSEPSQGSPDRMQRNFEPMRKQVEASQQPKCNR